MTVTTTVCIEEKLTHWRCSESAESWLELVLTINGFKLVTTTKLCE